MQMFCVVVVRAAARKGQVVCVCARGKLARSGRLLTFGSGRLLVTRRTLVLHLDTCLQVAVCRAARHQVAVCRAEGRGPLSLVRVLEDSNK